VAKSNIEQRRKVRELEAKRDRLMIAAEKARADLVNVRAALKHQRKAGVK